MNDRFICEEKDSIRKVWIHKFIWGGWKSAPPGHIKQYKFLEIIDTGDYILIIDEKIK